MSIKKVVAKALVVLAGLFLLSAPSVMAQEPCYGDFDCDGDVMQSDIPRFKASMGRWSGHNPCPDCYNSPCPCVCTAPDCDPPAPVEKTGQTTFYATGDDGDLEKGVAWPNPRFTDNGDGTITDNLTDLIWLKNANCFGIFKTWANALTSCNTLNSGECGLTDGSIEGDWRLPHVKEYISLMDFGRYPPFPEGHPFLNIGTHLRTSTTDPTDSTKNFYIYLAINAIRVLSQLKTDNAYVWPVRGGH